MINLQEEAESDTKIKRLMKEREAYIEADLEARQSEAVRRIKNCKSIVLTQMEEHRRRRLKALEKRREFGDTTIELSGQVPEPYLNKDQLLQGLEWQIRCKADNKKIDRVKQLDEEKEHLKTVSEELKEADVTQAPTEGRGHDDLESYLGSRFPLSLLTLPMYILAGSRKQTVQKRQQKEEAITILKATWDLDSHFKKCKKLLREKGGDAVMRYLDQMGIKEIILPEPTAKEKLMKSLQIGVGYDARGKKGGQVKCVCAANNLDQSGLFDGIM